ncbi:SprT-like domain-containing protein [Acidovorax sp. SUPP1855]|uniref:SprT-like domain-containing protein n=1 Tax=Acidovorax sp. SUPP1855 TaxID=431774 RepID=UPI0023DE686E|nr:SprT-like domain-containing protein [Acidovorax sp. SUPP1855]GKS87012.1 SprT-like domain-containing protein [Acidovorax sp. SUPP1855]
MSQPSKTTPTQQTYTELQQAYSHFNETLFGGALPGCLITLQREKRTCGYFSAQRFANLEGGMTDEIAMNPAYFAVVPVVETMQTLAHEMCHLWQSHFGKPGRGRYHNEEWASKMEAIGLMPSSTGQPGGKRTGDMMADYAIEGGPFLKACAELLTRSFRISWYDRFPAPEHVRAGQGSMGMHLAASVGGGSVPAQSIAVMASLVNPAATSGEDGEENPKPAANKSNRAKYVCPCEKQVWGKPGLMLICGSCRKDFEMQG